MPSMIFLRSETKESQINTEARLDEFVNNKSNTKFYKHWYKTGEIKLLRSYW